MQDQMTTSEGKLELSSTQKQVMVPGGVLRRAGAQILDGCIVGIVQAPLNIILMFIAIGAGGPEAAQSGWVTIVSWLISLPVIYFYYGHFYSKKGATPGKMALKLRVVDSYTGSNPTYGKAFLRETVGKFISAIVLGIGYLIAIFRSDKKTFHDMICGTQVLHVTES